MFSHLFTLSMPTDLYILLSFRAQNLTHVERIDIILEIERCLQQDDNKHIHLVWNTGFSDSNLVIWSESLAESSIPFNTIQSFFSSAKFEKYVLPAYLQKKMNSDASYIVFPEQLYIQSMLGTLGQQLK
ncbi:MULTISPECIES: hypothetical protein [Acinetobacter]|jgi:hypothetical protein|uniref:hypothetical protein n=1 Tax=Acinetobacter TaxID=469 RepID=UPI00035E1AB8|nr:MULTISPECIES: hypothetical protein [Acinetobacter]